MNDYERWLLAKKELNACKAVEFKLRNKILGSLLQDKLEGAKTVKDHGYKITATAKLIRSLDPGILQATWEDFTEEEKECITYAPKLNLAKYRKIEDCGGKLSEAITVKPAQATLSIEEIYEG